MRESLILKELKDSGDYLSLDYFSKKLEVSTRTIRNDMKIITNNEKCNGFKIEYKSKLGYIIQIEDEMRFELYLKSLSPVPLDSPEQRLDSITALLLLKDDYTTIEQLSQEFLVSTSLIKNDLKRLNKKLEDTNLELERKAHYGVKIIGPIKYKQNVLSEIASKENRKLEEFYSKFVSDKKMENIKTTEENILVKYKLEANFVELEELKLQLVLLYIKASLRRNNKEKGFTQLKVSYDDIIIEHIIREVFCELKFFITDEEKDYLSDFIKRKTKNKESEINSAQKDKLQGLIYNFFEEVDKEYSTYFLEDKEFFNLLYLHIASLIERVKRDQNLKNPFSRQISHQYPTVFNLAIQLSKRLEKEYEIKINQHEIGFIATHIAVPFEKRQGENFKQKYKIGIVCSSGGGSAYLIKLRLQEIFPNAEVKNFSLLDKEKIIEFLPDLIFSITDLSFEVNAPVILIKEILDDLDYLKIKESVRYVDDFGKVTNPQQYFLSLFSKKHFICIKRKLEYKDILETMAQKVVEDGACAPSYPKDVWERESFLNTIYTNGVTIPHPIEMTGNKNLISVALVQSDIEYEERKPQIIFMVSLIKGNLELHKQVTKHLSIIMEDKNVVNKLRGSQSYEEFMHKLKISLGV
ncbi:MAG: BglG family transcription antiterminator [Peptostreptococcaceae bacterium]|nr:BglG family transcription antiterminator [Peptostreptococcaceae bacterium]